MENIPLKILNGLLGGAQYETQSAVPQNGSYPQGRARQYAVGGPPPSKGLSKGKIGMSEVIFALQFCRRF